MLQPIRPFHHILALSLALCWQASVEAADVSSTWLGTTDQLWGTSSNWDPATTPNNGADTYDVTLPGSLAAPVLLNGPFTVRSLDVGAGSSLEINNGQTFTLNDSLDNLGTVSLMSTGGFTVVSITGTTASTVTFGGAGNVVLNSPTDRISGSTDHILVNDSPHTIRGQGAVGLNLLSLVNRGTILADSPTGKLIVDPRNTLENDGGTLSAMSGGVLELAAAAYTSTNGGSLVVGDGSTISLAGANIISSVLNVLDSDNDLANNIVDVTGSASVSDVTNNAALSITSGQTLTVGAGGLVNDGVVAPASTGGITNLSISGAVPDLSVMIGGTGAIELDMPNERIIGSTDHRLIHGPGHTIRGLGNVGANLISLTNHGTIVADDPAGILSLDPRNVLDNDGGLLSASSGGTLRLLGATYTSLNGGQLLVADGSAIELSSAALVDSSLNVDDQNADIADNVVTVVGTSSVSNVINNAALSITSGQTLTVGAGGLVNDGVVAPASTGGLTTISITGGGPDLSTEIGGSGDIVLDTPDERIIGATEHRLIHGGEHTIRGVGAVGANLIALTNHGTITADDNTGALSLDPRNTLDNDGGVLSASAGGTLRLAAAAYTSTNGGQLLVGDGSTIELAGANIVDSPINADDQDSDLSNNIVNVVGASSLSDTINHAALSITNGQTLTLGPGNVTNNGRISLASTGGFTTMSISGGDDMTVTIGGSGEILLDMANERVIGTTDHTLVNDTGHTIRGAGSLGVNLINIVNRGTIAADIAAGELNINDRTGGMVNSGTLSASGGGILTITDPLSQEGGAISVDAASMASVAGVVTHSGGNLLVDGSLSATSYIVSAGSVSGGGTLVAPFSTTGPATVSPAGTLDVDGIATLDGGTNFTTSVASSATADRLHATGLLTLTNAALQVTFTGTPASITAADTLTIASSDIGLVGTFSNALPGSRISSPNGLASFEVNYTPMAVTLSDVDHAPEFSGPTSFSIEETAAVGAVVGTLIATDIEGGTISYSISPGSPFAIDSESGQITTTAALDFETQTQYVFTATASDGALSRDTSVTIDVTNVLEDNLEVVTFYLTQPGGPFEGETDPAIIGIDADPDGDGRANIFELWVGSDPATPDTAPSEPVVKVLDVGGSDFGAVEIDVVIELDDLLSIDCEATFDLASWRSATSSRSVLLESAGRRTLQFIDPDSLPAAGPRFHARFTADEN